ncbi:19620_t:CDS:2, partial [Racocetra fulgida]
MDEASENCEETTIDQEGDFDILTFATKERFYKLGSSILRKSGGGIFKRGIKDFEPDGSIRQNDLLTESLNTLQNFLQEERKQVFTKLQIIQRCNIDLPMDNDQRSTYTIDFHVYKQSDNNKYKKKNPGMPFFHVVVACAESDQPPVLSTLENLFKTGNSSVLFAVVD